MKLSDYKKLSKPRKKPVQHERILHKQCVQWFKLQYPSKIIHHSPNGGKRDKREGKHFKEMGTLAGFPDIFIPEPIGCYHGLFIEIKFGDGKLSAAQKKLIKDLCDRGFFVDVVNSLSAYQEIVNQYFFKEVLDKHIQEHKKINL